MSPDDPRHGTRAGYDAHRRAGQSPCAGCTDAAARYERGRQWDSISGRPRLIPDIGTRRRLQALMASGWTTSQISDAIGGGRSNLLKLIARPRATGHVHAATAARVADLYERWSMKVPPQSPYATRARNTATRHGWPIPLAWDNIDDPNEQPTNWQYRPPNRLEVIAGLDEHQAGITKVCRTLKITPDALERWCARHDAWDLFKRLRDRERPVREAS